MKQPEDTRLKRLFQFFRFKRFKPLNHLYRFYRFYRGSKSTRIAIRLVLVIALLFGAIHWFSGKDTVSYASNANASRLLNFKAKTAEPSYAMAMLDHPEAGAKAAEAQPIPIVPTDYAQAGPGTKLESGQADGELDWQSEDGWVEWKFQAPQAGWYELHLDYKPLPGGKVSVVRGIQIDGRYSYLESEHLELERQWKDAKYPYDRNEIGMQVRPRQTELSGWTDKALSDYSVSSRPLLFRLEQGEHTLRLVGEREPVALRAISFQPQAPIVPYQEYAASQPAAAAEASWYAMTEAEQFQRKSSLTIQTDHWAEPYISPDPKGRVTYNVLGGTNGRIRANGSNGS